MGPHWKQIERKDTEIEKCLKVRGGGVGAEGMEVNFQREL